MRDPIYMMPRMRPEKKEHYPLKEVMKVKWELHWEDVYFAKRPKQRRSRAWWLNPFIRGAWGVRRRSWSWEFLRRQELKRIEALDIRPRP